MTIPTDEQLAEWQWLADAATPETWRREIGNDYKKVRQFGGHLICEVDIADDGNFIAAARQAVPALLEAVHELKAELAAAHNEIHATYGAMDRL